MDEAPDGYRPALAPAAGGRVCLLWMALWLVIAPLAAPAIGQQSPTPDQKFGSAIAAYVPPPTQTLPLYEGAPPNRIAAPDEERSGPRGGIEKVSNPTITTYLPGIGKAAGSAIIIFPGGGYVMESYDYEGKPAAETFRDHGIAAFIVKYRLPSDAIMPDKSIGPLQDAQQAIRLVRQNAKKWNVEPTKIGIIGFSAGGHLASAAGTHFSKSYIPNDDSISLRPDFMVLVYPVISMTDELTHRGSRDALLGRDPTPATIQSFSNEQHVSDQTPPTFLVHATDDRLVDVDNSVVFYEALHHHNVPAEMVLLAGGNHGFFTIPRSEWMQPVLRWLARNGWMKQ
jgi:acetyl esterase/lipase